MAENRLDNDPSLVQGLTDNAVSNVEGIFSAKRMAKYLSGARCILRVNGKISGFAFQISWNINTSTIDIETIDDPLPHEIAPRRIEVNGQISGFRIPGSGPTQEFIQSDVTSFLHQRYIDIEVRDSQTDNIIFVANNAMVTSRSENIRTDNLANMTLSFKAIGWADERTPQLPDGVGLPVDREGTNPITKLSDQVRSSLDI